MSTLDTAVLLFYSCQPWKIFPFRQNPPTLLYYYIHHKLGGGALNMKISRKERVSMCQKIKEIHGLQPANILSAYLDSTASFVNMQDILSKMGIPCIKADFSELGKSLNLAKDDAIWGLAASRGEDLIIAYSKKLDFLMQNYVLAHELGHCCRHLPISAEFHVELKKANDVYSDSSISSHKFPWIRMQFKSEKFSLKESEADEFAAQLLLPDALLNKYYARNAPLTAQNLSKDLKVPIRFAQAKIDHYSKKYGDE